MASSDPAALIQKALTFFNNGDLSGAIASCRNVLARIPNQPDALHLLALSFARARDTQSAEKAFVQAARVHPLQHEVLNNHGNLLRRSGRAEEAIPLLWRAVQARPEFYQGWFSLGLAFSTCDMLEDAVMAYENALALKPDHAEVMANLGGALNKLERYDEAETILRKAHPLNPQSAILHHNLGSVLTSQDDLHGAVEQYITAARLAPDNAEIHANLARAHHRMGQYGPALEAYARAVALEPGNLDAQDDYNRLLWESGQSDVFLQSIEQALPTLSGPRRINMLLLKARLAKLTARAEVAIDAMSEVLSLDRRNARALAGLAFFQAAAGEREKAAELYRQAIAADTDDYDNRHEFAEFLLAGQDFDEAVKILDRQAPLEHLQKHIALKALALRGKGDQTYEAWYDYDLLTSVREVHLPSGFSSIEAFLSAVEEELEPLFETKQAPADQTLFNGVQSPGHLWHHRTPALVALKSALLDTAMQFVDELPEDPDHPFLSRKSDLISGAKRLVYSAAWAVKLSSGGGHLDHIHPAGWISASHYVRVPETINKEQGEKGGWLRLGASGVSGFDLPAEKYLCPSPGAVILFPSYMWHGVEPFRSDKPRITTPFDLAFK